MTTIRTRYLSLFVFALVSLQTGFARAVIFNDPFGTNPFTSRWCEKLHHAHWDSANFLLSGVNGSSCTPTVNSCCASCVSGTLGTCSGANGKGFLAITVLDRSGNDRNVSIDFAMQSPQFTAAPPPPTVSGEHVALFSTVHRACHFGIEAIVGSDISDPTKVFLQIIVLKNPLNPTDFPECEGTEPPIFSPKKFVTLATSTLPRYKLKLHTYLPSPPPSLTHILRADLIDNVTSATVATSATSITKPAWYNVYALRYGLGAVRYLSSGAVIPMDNFTSDSH